MQFRTLLTTASAVVMALGMMAGTAQAGNNNQMVVEQIGDDNFNDSGQSGSNNETLVQQNGNANTSSVSVAGGIASNNENIAVRQETNGNVAQYNGDAGGTSNNDFAVLQRGGNRNTAAINNSGNSGNQIGIAQDGTRNVVSGGASGNAGRGFGGGTITESQQVLTMTLQSSNPLTLTEDAPISGNGHFVGLDQIGSNNIVALSVSGSNNTIVGSTSSNSPVSGRTSIALNTDFGVSMFDGNPTIDGEARGANLTPRRGRIWLCRFRCGQLLCPGRRRQPSRFEARRSG